MKTTIFCPNCGTANRDNAEVCVECGSVIPKYGVESSETSQITPSSNDFGIDTSQSSPPPPPPPPQSSAPSELDFGISIGYPTPDKDAGYTPVGSKIICERCGSVLRSDDNQCPGCGQLIQKSTPPPQNPQSTPLTQSYPTQPSPYTPIQKSTQQSTPQTKQPSKSIAKCAKCGSIVYDHETRCNNCGRILSSPKTSKKPKKPTPPVKPSMPYPYAPVGTARCGRCNAIVYPNQTVCPNCSKPLEAVKQPRDVLDGPGQRMSRCRRCGHVVYPTDSICPNCGRDLDPMS